MPGEKIRETCQDCAGWLDSPPLERCTEPENHDVPKPGKGFNPPYVAEAVTAIEEDDEEKERKPPWQP